MKNKRLFISLPLDPAVSRDIDKKIKNLNLPGDKLKFIPPEQMHLTLKFLGDTPLQNIPEIIEALDNIKTNFEYLEIHINQTEIFNKKQPKILAAKIEDNNKLNDLYKKIDDTLFEAALANKEIRNFRAHITLARVKKSSNFSEFSDFINWDIKKSFSSSHFDLQESSLGKLGPEYTVLQSFNL